MKNLGMHVPESVHRPVSIRACDEPWNSPFKIKTHQNLPVLPQPVCTSSTINNALNCEQNYHTCKKEVPKYKIHVLNAEIAKNFTVLQGKETFYFHFANIACIIEQYYMKNSGTPPRGHLVRLRPPLFGPFFLGERWRWRLQVMGSRNPTVYQRYRIQICFVLWASSLRNET